MVDMLVGAVKSSYMPSNVRIHLNVEPTRRPFGFSPPGSGEITPPGFHCTLAILSQRMRYTELSRNT